MRIDRDDFRGAEALLDQSLRLRSEAAPGSLAEAASWHALGRLERTRGDYAKAEAHFRRALALRERWAPNSAERAATLNNLGIVAWTHGDAESAEALYAQALTIVRRRAPGSLGEAQILNNLGILRRELGRLAAAEESFQASYRISVRLDPDGPGTSFLLANLGALAFDRGNFALSESYQLATLERTRAAAPAGLEVAKCLYNLGLIAERRRDLAGAETLFRQAHAIHRKLVPDTLIEAGTLLALAETASLAGRLEEARRLGEQAWALHSRLAPQSEDAAANLVVLARIALDRRDIPTARRLAEESLQHRLAHHASGQSQARSRVLLGEIAYQGGDDINARRQDLLALALLQSFQPHSVETAGLFTSLGLIELRGGHPRRAEDRFRQAVDALEGQMRSLGGGDEQLISFEESYLPAYLNLLERQMARGDDAGALLTLERSRARGLLSLLAQRDLVFGADLSPALRERKANLDRERSTVQRQIADLDPRRKSEVAHGRNELTQLNRQRAALNAEIARASPRYSALQNPRPLDLAGIRRTLDPGTVYLAYALGTTRSWLFAVSHRALKVFPLPTTREDAAREVGIFRSLLLQGAEEPSLDGASRIQALRLYRLLIAPAESELRVAERILVSPDGALHVLPFGALLRPPPATSFLAEWKPLHTVVSATLYAELRARRHSGAEPSGVVAFADPAYRHPRGSASASESPLRRYSLGLPRLPATREEAESLAALYGRSARIYLGSEASEGQATHLAPGVRIVHFATHALLDRSFPLDSALALAAPSTGSLDGSDDGLLQAWEILERVRLDADLVTLSACETGLGANSGGEGLIGLTRAFQYAGARSILASLWSVSDRSTAELMKRFYVGLRAGLPKDRALQEAQRQLLRDDGLGLAHPYHWAAFEMIGDWR